MKQYILLTCVDNQFGHPDGFSERVIREHLGIEDWFYELRTVGGAAGVVLDDLVRLWFENEVRKIIFGPMTSRAGAHVIDEVVVIATVHRSCGGCEGHHGADFGTDAELLKLEDLLHKFATTTSLIEFQDAAPKLTTTGLILTHEGAVFGEPIHLTPELVS